MCVFGARGRLLPISVLISKQYDFLDVSGHDGIAGLIVLLESFIFR